MTQPTEYTPEQQLDTAHRERAHLVAWLAALHPAVITEAPDVDEPGWQIVYITADGSQCSWHIAPRDAELFEHVERVQADDPRAQWDGHTTDQKYTRIRLHTRDRAMHRCGLPHYEYPESTCAETAGHTGVHAAALIIDGQHRGSVSWGPGIPPGGNAEDCPACEGTNPPYPFICPGHPAPEQRAEDVAGCQHPVEPAPAPDAGPRDENPSALEIAGGLRGQYAAALRDALRAGAYSCDGDCGMPEQACTELHPVQVAARSCGAVSDVYGPVDAIADLLVPAVLAVRDTALDQPRGA
jgi:hypothetical protein